MEKGVDSFHLIFLAKYSIYLGFAPRDSAEIELQFKEFGIQIPVEKETQKYLDLLFKFDFIDDLRVNKAFRNHLLDVLLAFYRIHQEEFGELKSLQVLRALFN